MLLQKTWLRFCCADYEIILVAQWIAFAFTVPNWRRRVDARIHVEQDAPQRAASMNSIDPLPGRMYNASAAKVRASLVSPML
ncbi:MAG: hypothetical protein DLM68_07630 [Hyphomicrobiales bacterium]|nr:MAG: hypothetical protein DLM68_07630 [Hyphomicrobiales bacterium]